MSDRSWLRRGVLLVMFGVLVIGSPASAGETVDPQVMLHETQRMDSSGDHLNLVWWIPNEYWKVVSASDPSFGEDALQLILDALGEYSVFAIVEGTMSDEGESSFAPESKVRGRLHLKVDGGQTYAPLPNEQVASEAKSLIDAMRPVMENLLGPMGKNLNFFFFPARTEEGRAILDPRETGSFEIQLGERAYAWRLPLSSLLPRKICPVDGEEMTGAWTFCPWHGKELESQKQQKIKPPPAKESARQDR